MPVLVIYNPACGDGNAKTVYERSVEPVLRKASKIPDKVVATEQAGHAGKLLVEFLESFIGEIAVILLSGDGTLNEIINHLSATQLSGPRASTRPPRIHLVLVPCGTANALYSSLFPPVDQQDEAYKLKSLQAFVAGTAVLPLKLAISTLSYPPSQRRKPEVAISAVVTSTCLHAAILRDSEALRLEVPGIERFKIAAQKNRTKWYNSHVKLLPALHTGVVQVYDPATKCFVEHPESDSNDIVDLYGPFAYFLSTVNVDRLEPAFRITPVARDEPSTEANLDIVIVRPLRDPSLSLESPEAREAFSDKLWSVMSAAYRDGAHLHLRYNEKGEILPDGEGPFVVEYIRCGGWEWIPDDLDGDAHLLCSDGTIFLIEKNGRAVCNAATPDEAAGFVIHV